MKQWIAFLALLPLGMAAQANEGMWQPHQLPALSDELKALGMELDASEMSELTAFPMNAVINFGGCTASFVSPKGLLVTNHHCGYGAIQYHSTSDNNILENGFLANTLAQEKTPVPGYKIWITESITPVTDQVVGAVDPKLTGADYFDAIEGRTKALVAECESADNARCDVYNFHHGAQYFLVKEMEIKDVRLVYTPSMAVGKYGGDIDNWMWPRHTGDFAFFRAYVGPDGKPAEYSEDNVPFEPVSHLKVSSAGLEDGDFVMVAGYPGRTNRYRTALEVKTYFETIYPQAKVLREEIIEIIKANSEAGSDARIKYEGTLAGLANYAKNYQSMIEGYAKTGILAAKQADQTELVAWINGKGDRAAKYGDVLTQLDKLVAEQWQHAEKDLILGYLRYNQMSSVASRLYRLAKEKQKPDLERKKGYQERDWEGFKASMERMDRRFDANVDQAILHHLLRRYAALPKSERDGVLDRLFGLEGDVDAKRLMAKLDSMYAATELADKAVRLAWLDKSPAEFEASADPFIRFAVANYDKVIADEEKEKNLDGQLLKVRPEYMAAIIAFNQSQGRPVYADANSSLRLTYGTVKGYSPQDGLVAKPFTTLEGLAAKATDQEPFDASAKQLALIARGEYGRYGDKAVGSVPVNFLSTLDSTGGNSGSPTFNGKGELVGLLFDGVYESITADWSFNPELSRSIHVDSRYMLWVMDHLDGADRLLDEMEIVQ